MLGGDSIVSIQLVSKIREILGYTLSIKDIFKYKTIELLYDNVLINQSDKKEIKTEQGILKGEFDLLPPFFFFLLVGILKNFVIVIVYLPIRFHN